MRNWLRKMRRGVVWEGRIPMLQNVQQKRLALAFQLPSATYSMFPWGEIRSFTWLMSSFFSASTTILTLRAPCRHTKASTASGQASAVMSLVSQIEVAATTATNHKSAGERGCW